MCDQALQAAKSIPSARQHAAALDQLAQLLLHRGEIDEAVVHLEQSLTMRTQKVKIGGAEKIADPHGQVCEWAKRERAKREGAKWECAKRG